MRLQLLWANVRQCHIAMAWKHRLLDVEPQSGRGDGPVGYASWHVQASRWHAQAAKEARSG